MRSVREAIDRLRSESNGQLLVSTVPSQEDEQETPKNRDPALFYAIAAQNWEQAERLVEAGIGLEYRKVSLIKKSVLSASLSVISFWLDKLFLRAVEEICC